MGEPGLALRAGGAVDPGIDDDGCSFLESGSDWSAYNAADKLMAQCHGNMLLGDGVWTFFGRAGEGS